MREGWNEKSLGEVCTMIKRGVAPKYTDEKSRTVLNQKCIRGHKINLKFARQHNESLKPVKEERLVEIGDVLVNSTGTGTLGRVAQVLDPEITGCTVDTHVTIVRPKKELFDLSFFGYAMISIEAQIKDSGEGASGQTELRRTTLSDNFKIRFPDSLPEQKAIVRLLDRAFAAIDQAQANIEKNIANAEELFQSKLEEIFSQRGEGWEIKKLGELGKVSMCKRIFKKQTSATGEIPFYKIGTFGKNPNAYISKELYVEYRNKYSFPKKGDILLSASGTIGRRVIYDGEPAYFQDSNIVWIDNDEKVVLNEYLYHFYGFCDWNPSKGATISRLYNNDLRRIPIPIPPQSKQKSIVQKIEKIDLFTEKIKNSYEEKLGALENLKKSLLQKAFTGELTQKEIQL